MKPGISVVLCCHNSAERLPKTLTCLTQQTVDAGIPWEVIVVDNQSNDGTADIARAMWRGSSPAPLHIVSETRLGLSHARVKGFESAGYEYVSFIDDDNRVACNWVATAYDIMKSNPEIGACGGRLAAEFGAPPPPWWNQFAGCFAVGTQWREQGDITRSKGWLYGAGLTVRLSAWKRLRHQGFRFQNVDRQGSLQSAGGDSELCYALRQSGWKLWLDWRLELTHFIPEQRLTWNYLCRSYRGFGRASVTLWLYERTEQAQWEDYLRNHWIWQSLATMKQIVSKPSELYAFLRSVEGDESVLRMESRIGRLQQFLTLRKTYAAIIRELRDAPWKQVSVANQKNIHDNGNVELTREESL